MVYGLWLWFMVYGLWLILLLKSKIEVFSFVQFIQPLAESKKIEKECSSAATLDATLEP
jgi:hypothetical protein